jgi:hypothetical protein
MFNQKVLIFCEKFTHGKSFKFLVCYRIYVGFQSPSIIKYLEPLMGYLFISWYTDSIFDEEHFPVLGGEFTYQKEC